MKRAGSRGLALLVALFLVLSMFEFSPAAYAAGENSYSVTTTSEDGQYQFKSTITSYNDAIIVQVDLLQTTADLGNFKVTFARSNSVSLSKSFDKTAMEVTKGDALDSIVGSFTSSSGFANIAAANFFFQTYANKGAILNPNTTGTLFIAKLPVQTDTTWDKQEWELTLTYGLWRSGTISATTEIASFQDTICIPAASEENCPDNWDQIGAGTGDSDDPGTSTAGGSIPATGEIPYDVVWGYGGTVAAAETGYTITPIEGYAIDEIWVDGVLDTSNQTAYQAVVGDSAGASAYTWSSEAAPARSLVVTFAYTVNFPDPANGTLSVSRGSETLTSGSIVRGGDILTITAEPADGYTLSALNLTGIDENEDGTYTVTAEKGDPTPSISAEFTQAAPETPVFSEASGEVLLGTQVTITTATAGAEIYYTTDGSDPSSTSGSVYSGPITITEDMTLKAVAVKDKYTSETATAAYTLKTAYLYVQPGITNGTVSVEAGKVTLTGGDEEKPAQGYVGQTVTVTVTPDAGYRLARLAYSYSYSTDSSVAADSLAAPTVTADQLGAGTPFTTSFSMPDANVTVSAAFEKSAAGNGATGTTPGTSSSNWAIVEITGGEERGETETSIEKAVEIRETVTVETVKTADDLFNLALSVNAGVDYTGKTVTLADDVELTGAWTPIGTEANPFTGTFDGGGHTISGLSITRDQWDDAQQYVGLFGYVKNAVIQRVTVKGTITVTSSFEGPTNTLYARSGGVAGYASNSTLSGCTSYVILSVDTRAATGGIAGETLYTTLENCINYGAITHDVTYPQTVFYTGGVVGALGSGTMTACANYADIYLEGNQTPNGSAKGDADTLVDYNTGSVGGLAGSASGVSTIQTSHNSGNIAGDMKSAGGLLGYYASTAIIRNCYNTGNITMDGNADFHGTGTVYLAGLSPEQVTPTNCYNLGTVRQTGTSEYVEIYELTRSTTTRNSYTAAEMQEQENIDALLAVLLEDGETPAYVLSDSGLPILYWEADMLAADTNTYAVTFTVTPANAQVTLYSDMYRENVIGTGLTYELKTGTYFYTVSAEGYGTENGSLTVSGQPVSVDVTLREVVTVTFQVIPADAEFFLTLANSEDVIQPDEQTETEDYALYTYMLTDGLIYVYNAYAKNYNGVSHEYPVNGDATVLVKLTNRGVATDTVWGDSNYDENGEELPHIIDHGDSYYIGDGATGIITIDTTEEVILVGTGVGLRDAFEDLYIDCVQAGTDLTLQDVFISNTSGSADPKMTNMIDFTGRGNYLNFAGVSILDENTGATGYAMIHVGDGTELTVTGGIAYLYKYEQGAGIGGNGGADGGDGQTSETNGTITIRDAELFIKGAKQGAAIGAGAQAGTQEPGSITIMNSTLYVIGESRGAAIGGSAGSSGASSGSSVYVDEDSTVTINVNYTGAAIGGGGYDGGNDSDGGTLVYGGGSIRTYLGTNAVGFWGLLSAGVNGNAAITADVVDSRDNPLYLLEFDTTLLAKSASRFTVKDEDGDTLYSGGLHEYRYINEDVDKYGQANITYTMDNWVPLDDPCLYLYLPGEDQTITVNNQKFSVTWTGDGFKVGPAKTSVLVTTEVIDGIAYTTVDSDALTEALEGMEKDDQLVIEADLTDAETRYLDGAVTTLTITDVWNIAMADVSLLISSPIADIELSSIALEDITGEWGNSVTFSAIEEKDGVHIEVAVDERVMETIKDGLWVTLPVENRTAGTVLVLVDEDGNETVLEDAVFGKYSVTVWVEGSCILKLTEQPVKLLATTVVEDGVATTTINSNVLAEVLENADASTRLVIEVVIPEGESVYESTVILTQKDTKAIAETGASLEIDSPLADIVLPNTALKDLADRNGKEITITSTEQKSGTSIKVAVDGKSVGTVKGGLLVSLPGKTTAGSVMVLVDAYGGETVIKKSAVGKYSVTARLTGSCTVKVIDNTKTFADVLETDWYADAVTFAAAHELFNGVSDTLFAPTQMMDRAMLVTVLHRLEDTPAAAALNSFSDVPAGTWYTDAVIWANANEIVKGYGNGSFGPTDSVTREQIATILYRYMQYLGLDTSASGSLSKFADGGTTSDWANEAMRWAVGAGIITGKDIGADGLILDPGGVATRAEVATMLQRLINLMVQ